ncbi:hypothetical protein M440DRAFT_1234663 [Trichoderma longibrachiatum ATCC 18648]|uniref:Uncharacterized protein n=1 Tax=Trichoderma longibrachiatum ATCC 18648 TaxID=983965 RepID=A0A2T4C5H9_TRILO|nr:hypothetical protein M440DRAFT_1234663 [Trichoderma longibrachiatum ATCC 18648]
MASPSFTYTHAAIEYYASLTPEHHHLHHTYIVNTQLTTTNKTPLIIVKPFPSSSTLRILLTNHRRAVPRLAQRSNPWLHPQPHQNRHHHWPRLNKIKVTKRKETQAQRAHREHLPPPCPTAAPAVASCRLACITVPVLLRLALPILTRPRDCQGSLS